MMRGSALISAIAHGAALALIGRAIGHDRPREHVEESHAPRPTASLQPLPARATEPIEVSFVTLPPETRSGIPAVPRRGRPRAVARPAGDATPVAPASRDTATIAASSSQGARDDRMMHMRGLDAPAVGDVLDRIATSAGHEAPPAVAPSGKLREAGRDRAVIHDKVTTVSVDADGTAHFHDKADVDIHIMLPLLTPGALRRMKDEVGSTISTWSADPYARTRVGATADLPRHLQAVPGECDDANNAMCDATSSAPAPGDGDEDPGLIIASPIPIVLIFGKLDITSWAMRKAGIDPYASRKLRLLDQTRDERAVRGARYRTEQLQHSTELMRHNLEAVWRATADLATRHASLFELWDECTEGAGPIGEAGERARAQVIGWIRQRLPAGTADAFSEAEVAALNTRRSSKQPFAPY